MVGGAKGEKAYDEYQVHSMYWRTWLGLLFLGMKRNNKLASRDIFGGVCLSNNGVSSSSHIKLKGRVVD